MGHIAALGKSLLGGAVLLIVAILSGCASNGALVDPLIYWDQDDAEFVEKYGPTPTEKIQQLDKLAGQARNLSEDERVTQSEKISQALPEEQNSVIRVHMVRTLGKLNTEASFAGLKSSLYDEDASVRREATKAIAASKNPAAVPLLGDVLTRDRDYDVRLSAATALGAFDSPAAKQALIPALDARDPAMRFAAIESLRKTSDIDYRGDTAKWREFAQGGSPEAPPATIADRLVPSFLR